MRKRVFFILFIASYLIPSSILAQDVPRVERLEIDLWPEYDRLEMLVILRLQLADDVLLPTTVELSIPRRVGGPSAVAKWDPNTGPNDQVRWSSVEDGEWIRIVIETDTSGIWLEYYDALTLEGSERSYTFQWLGGFEIGSFRCKVQQPKTAESMHVSGAADIVEDGGLKYHVVDFGALTTSQSIQVDVSYTNTIGQLTNPATIIRPEETQGSTPDVSAWLPYVIGGFGALILIFGFIFWSRLHPGMGSGSWFGEKEQKNNEAEPGQTTRAERFCHYCGTRAHRDDNFCRNCGTKLRRG